MDEKKLLDQIRQSASDLTPPESLNPDAIEKLLTPKKPARKKFFTLCRLAGAAVVFVLCAVSFRQVQKIEKYSSSPEKQMTENIVSQEADAGADTADDSNPDSSSKSSGSSSESAGKNTGTKNNSKTVTGSNSDNDSPDTSALRETEKEKNTENSPLLPTAQSYEEVYSALREKFYYEDDAAYDVDMGMGVLTASTSAAAAINSTAEIAVDGAAPASTADTAAGSSENGAVYFTAGAMENGTTASSEAKSNSIEIPEPAEEEYQPEAAAEDSAAVEKDADYSKTNIQEFGVDEADIVKTDGKYIYILRRNSSVTIVDARDPQNLKNVSTIPPADSDLFGTNELYVDGDILNVIATRQSTSLEQDGDVYYPSSTRQTVLYTYDISDRAAPKLSGTAIQDGNYQTSRKNGSFIYLFTFWYPDLEATYQESRIIPTINGVDLEATDFYIPESLTSSSYLLISSVNTEDPKNILDKKALVSGTSNFYVSPENIYIANENWDSGTTVTDIMKFHYEDGMITGIAAGSVKGYLNNSFSLNEYNDSLRVVSTCYDANYEEQNGLYILDEALHITGSIENLAEGETIRSARFFGDIGYFVTFRQTDPLFSVDLSDPAAPEVLGELKVSGFSSYLHFYGKDLLLGMGYEADEQTGITSGVKLSMFDISDPANVTELHRLVIPGVTWCPSLENYKSILIDPQKNIFGFFCGERYLVFSYDREKGFVSELVYDFIQDALSEQAQTPEGTSADSHFEDNESSNSADLDTYETGSVPGSIFVPLDGDTASSDASESSAGKTSENYSQAVPEFEISTSDSAYYPSISADNTRGLYIGDTLYLAGDVSVIAFDMADSYSRMGKLPL